MLSCVGGGVRPLSIKGLRRFSKRYTKQTTQKVSSDGHYRAAVQQERKTIVRCTPTMVFHPKITCSFKPQMNHAPLLLGEPTPCAMTGGGGAGVRRALCTDLCGGTDWYGIPSCNFTCEYMEFRSTTIGPRPWWRAWLGTPVCGSCYPSVVCGSCYPERLPTWRVEPKCKIGSGCRNTMAKM